MIQTGVQCTKETLALPCNLNPVFKRTCSQPYPLVDIHKIKDLSSCFVKKTRRFPICGSLYLNTVPKVVRSRAKRSAQRVSWFSVLNLLLTP